MKRLFVYDGECTYARAWAADWEFLTGSAVEYCPYHEAETRFPNLSWDLPREDISTPWHFIDEHGEAYEGAEAVFQALRHAPRRAWLCWLHEHAAPFRNLTGRAAAALAYRRDAFDALYRVLSGKREEPVTYYISQWIFLRLLAVVCIFAFGSFWWQMPGLIGESGIMPAVQWLEQAGPQLGDAKWRQAPTLLWLHQEDIAIHVLCGAGMVAASLVLVGFIQPVALAAIWACYLSLVMVSAPFLNFQWDSLLLETLLLATFFVPLNVRTGPHSRFAISPTVLFLLKWLLFRLMFSSGYVKLEDTTWTDWDALKVHYETQPLPHVLSWFAHNLPEALHEYSVAAMFVIELAAPLLIFGPRRVRACAGAAIIALQLLIFFTGNYGFFNVLAIALCVLCFDDVHLSQRMSGSARHSIPRPHVRPKPPLLRPLVSFIVFAALFPAGAYFMIRTLDYEPPIPNWSREHYLAHVVSFRAVNTYGLFARMTTNRPELIIQGTRDGITWETYEFRWKPGAPDRAPGWAQPHMPRLDWQMWFAALGTPQQNPWMRNFLVRLQQNAPAVTALLKVNPFPDLPPRQLRVLIYDYRFTTPEERENTGHWWRRDFVRSYY